MCIISFKTVVRAKRLFKCLSTPKTRTATFLAFWKTFELFLRIRPIRPKFGRNRNRNRIGKYWPDWPEPEPEPDIRSHTDRHIAIWQRKLFWLSEACVYVPRLDLNAEQLLNSHPFSQSFKNLDLKAFCCLLATPGCVARNI